MIEDNLEYFLHLCHQKNELNRRRRRFWYQIWYGSYHDQYEARRGYRKAKADMKAMTPEMRALRKALEVEILWGKSGNIKAIRDIGQNWYVYAKNFKSYSELWLADEALGLI